MPTWSVATFVRGVVTMQAESEAGTVAAASLWAVDTWVLGTLPPGVIEPLLAMGAAELGVALAVWDQSRCGNRQAVAPDGQRYNIERVRFR